MRTYSGKVVYKRAKHFWTAKDVERVSAKMEVFPPQKLEENWITTITDLLQQATINMLEKIIPFLDEKTVTQIYYLIYEVLGKLFSIDTGRYTDGNKEALVRNIIERLATQNNLTAAVTRRP